MTLLSHLAYAWFFSLMALFLHVMVSSDSEEPAKWISACGSFEYSMRWGWFTQQSPGPAVPPSHRMRNQKDHPDPQCTFCNGGNLTSLIEKTCNGTQNSVTWAHACGKSSLGLQLADYLPMIGILCPMMLLSPALDSNYWKLYRQISKDLGDCSKLTVKVKFRVCHCLYLNHLKQTSSTFPALRLSGRGRGWFCTSGSKACTHSSICVHTACANGMCAHVLSCCSCKWGCILPTTISTAWLQMAQGPIVGHSPGVKTPDLKQSLQPNSFMYIYASILGQDPALRLTAIL